MDLVEPSARPLLSVSNDRLDIPLQERPLPSASVSTASTDGPKPLRNPRQAKRTSRICRCSSRARTTIVSGWKSCVQAWKRVWTRSWTSETCGYIVSILALAGLIATLLAHQNKPLPQWPQLITINSIISLFSLLMRAGTGVVLAEGISQCKWNWYHKSRRLDHMDRLDSASRGSWGSVTLLYHFRPKSAYYLAAFGAIITIMASLTGFFTQQLVQFQDCFERDTAAVVSISRSNTYARSGGSYQNNAPVDFAPMIAAINVGVMQPVTDLTNVLSSGCNSGNCSFPNTNGASFDTIAFSHFCQDITAHIRTVNESTNIDSRNWTMGYLALDYGNNKTVEWPREQGGTVLKAWIGGPSSRANFTIFITMNFVYRSSWWENYDWKAINCSLSLTVNTYGASINNSILEENLLNSIPLQPTGDQFMVPPVPDADLQQELNWWSYKMTTNVKIRNGIPESCEGSESPAPNHARFMKRSDDPTYLNSAGHVSKSVGWKWWYYPRDCIWSIHKFPVMAIHDTLTSVFDSQEAIMGTAGGVDASAHMRQLFLDGNMTFDTVNERIGALATSMTAVIRTHDGDGIHAPPASAKGDVWTKTTCIYIQWPWITFPTIMIGFTGLFLMLTVIENRGVEHDRLWKSSFLAALFCEVETPNRPIGKAEMKAHAESTSVSLEGKNGGVLRLILH